MLPPSGSLLTRFLSFKHLCIWKAQLQGEIVPPLVPSPGGCNSQAEARSSQVAMWVWGFRHSGRVLPSQVHKQSWIGSGAPGTGTGTQMGCQHGGQRSPA